MQSSRRSIPVSSLPIQFFDCLMEFLIEVANHVIQGDVSLPLGLKVIFVLNEPRVDLLTHLDFLHRLPLCTPPRLLCGLLPHGVVTFAIISQSYLIARPRITAHAPVSMKAARALWHTRVHT
jgi:hypothetical protein